MPDLAPTPSPQVLRIEGRGMLSLRAAAEAGADLASALGTPAPAPRRLERAGARSLAWMSPDEWLLQAPRDDLPALAEAARAALGDRPHLIVDVSDARALFRIEGPGARDVLAKGAPVDLSRAAFGPGDFRRTRLGQVACAFWLAGPGDAEAFELVCVRSVADHVGAWLVHAARPGAAPGVL
ncbi:MAG: sarcosine oxidase subunit gamma family protein [Pseudomonadota bacterium]